MRIFLPLIIAGISIAATNAPSPRVAREDLAYFAKCTIHWSHDRARTAILDDLGSKTIQDDWKHLVLSECVRRRGTMIFMSHDMYRGALAEELILVDRIQPPLEGFSSISALSYREPEPIAMVRPDGKSNTPANIELQRTANNKYLASIARLRLGECVSRQEPMKSRALFYTAIGSPAELSALQSFQGAISSCIVAGETVAFDRMTLRGVIAVGLYRLANASQSSGVSH